MRSTQAEGSDSEPDAEFSDAGEDITAAEGSAGVEANDGGVEDVVTVAAASSAPAAATQGDVSTEGDANAVVVDSAEDGDSVKADGDGAGVGAAAAAAETATAADDAGAEDDGGERDWAQAQTELKVRCAWRCWAAV